MPIIRTDAHSNGRKEKDKVKFKLKKGKDKVRDKDKPVKKKKKYKENPNAPKVSPPEVSEREQKRRASVHRNLKQTLKTFREDSPDIQQLLEQDSDRASERFQRRALAMLIDLIPVAEAKYRERAGEHSAYALNSLISQARELISDIQAGKDSEELVNTLGLEILKPCFTAIAQSMIDNIYRLRRRVERNIKPSKVESVNEAVDDMAKEFAAYLENQYTQTYDLVRKKMLDD